MARVLLVGIDPDEVDFSDPALVPGLDAAKIRAGVAVGVAALSAAGHQVDQLYIPAAPAAAIAALAAHLARGADAVVIGGGVHMPLGNRPLFEAMLNAIGRHDPTPAIALIARPQDAADGAARALATRAG